MGYIECTVDSGTMVQTPATARYEIRVLQGTAQANNIYHFWCK